MMRRAFYLLMILLLSSSILPAQKRAFTIEDLYRVKNLSDLHVSPDGKTLLFALTTSDLGRATPVDDRRKERIFTSFLAGWQANPGDQLKGWKLEFLSHVHERRRVTQSHRHLYRSLRPRLVA
jgi:hypothetical protein